MRFSGSIDSARDSLFKGAWDYLTKPCDLDLLSASENDNRIAWYRNDVAHGKALFDDGVPIVPGDTLRGFSPEVFDVDGDGDPDLLTSHSVSGNTLFGVTPSLGLGNAGFVFRVDVRQPRVRRFLRRAGTPEGTASLVP